MIAFAFTDKDAPGFAEHFDQVAIETSHVQVCRINGSNQMYSTLILRI